MEEKKEMTLNEYQRQAMTTCMDSCDNFSYMALNLIGEVGEFCSKVAKEIRKGNAYIGEASELPSNLIFSPDAEKNEAEFEHEAKVSEEMKKEAGDILWQLSGLCKVMGWDLEGVAKQNLEKLASRKARGVIEGNGDNR